MNDKLIASFGSQENLRKVFSAAAVAAAAAFAVYLPVLGNGFVNFDDGICIYANPYLRAPDAGFIKWAFTYMEMGWIPLTWVSFSIDYMFWELDPTGYHLTNMILHSLNTFLVTLLTGMLMFQATGSLKKQVFVGAALSGVLFGVHPLHVESVAWATERKDVLFAFFYFLSLIAYLLYTSNNTRRKTWYSLSLVLFILSSLSKPMAVSLPILLVILDFYPLERLRKNGTLLRTALLEKLPFYLVSGLVCALTISSQKAGGFVVSTSYSSLETRLWLATRAVGFYLEKAFLPVDLSPIYPLPMKMNVYSAEYIGSLFVVLTVTLLCLLCYRRRPMLLALWAFFVVTLLPVIGVVQVGAQAAADRYMYVSLLGPILLVSTPLAKLYDRGGLPSKLMLTVVLTVIVWLSTMTVAQTGVWKNTETLRDQIRRVSPDTYVHAPLGQQKAKSRRLSELSVFELTNALADKNLSSSVRAEIYARRGKLLEKQGQSAMAMKSLDEAIDLDPGNYEYLYSRGLFKFRNKELTSAISDFSKAANLNQDDARVFNSLGLALSEAKRYLEAANAYDRAIALDPDQGGLHLNKANACSMAGLNQEALEHYRAAARLDFKPAQNYLRSKKIDW
jgi:cytochrome c-type biogenesis protein CcmH/NrfG